MILRYFGEGCMPDYSRTASIVARDPYDRVRDRLAGVSEVMDITSIDSDLGFVLAFPGRQDQATIRLSVVGPFALITGRGGRVISPRDLVDLLVEEGFQMLGKQILERPFKFWSPEFERALYEFVFEFDEGFPWAR